MDLSPSEYENFRAILGDLVEAQGSPSAAARASGIANSSLDGLLHKGKTPLLSHVWGLALGLNVTPEAVVAEIRGVKLPEGPEPRSLVELLKEAPTRVQLECLAAITQDLQRKYAERIGDD